MPSKLEPRIDPLVISLSGYRACATSMASFLAGNGPFTLSKSGERFSENLSGWGERVSMLWVETPGGIGWSWAQGIENMG